MSFNFGSTNPYHPSTSANPAAQGFNFGGGTPAQAAGGGFSFGGAKSVSSMATGASSGFSFANPAGTTAASTPSTTAAALPASTAGFLFGAPNTQAQKTAGLSGFSLGGSTPTKPAGQGINLGLTPASTAPITGLGLGRAKQIAAAGPSTLGITPAKPTVSLGGANTGGLTLGGLGTTTPATNTGGLSLLTTPATNTGGFTLGGLGTTPATNTGGLNLGTTPATKAGGLTLVGAGAAGVLGGAKSAAPSGLTLSLGKTMTGLTAAPTAPVATLPAGPTMNYRELEEAINKWTVELEEQEKVFLQQATQVNGWDRLLVENGEKITVLHNDVEKVKTDQQRLEHELDYIVAQQRELEDMLAPLEETIKTQQGSTFTQHADGEREHTYQLAETMDSQLKRMVQDLKEVIEHLNTSNTTGESNDPIQQIAKILNAHMDSLQWIDHNTAMCQRKVDEISRQSEIVRRDQERNVQLAFD